MALVIPAVIHSLVDSFHVLDSFPLFEVLDGPSDTGSHPFTRRQLRLKTKHEDEGLEVHRLERNSDGRHVDFWHRQRQLRRRRRGTENIDDGLVLVKSRERERALPCLDLVPYRLEARL